MYWVFNVSAWCSERYNIWYLLLLHFCPIGRFKWEIALTGHTNGLDRLLSNVTRYILTRDSNPNPGIPAHFLNPESRDWRCFNFGIMKNEQNVLILRDIFQKNSFFPFTAVICNKYLWFLGYRIWKYGTKQTSWNCKLVFEMLSWSTQLKDTSWSFETSTKSNPPTEAQQTQLHGFLPSTYWPNWIPNLSTLW